MLAGDQLPELGDRVTPWTWEPTDNGGSLMVAGVLAVGDAGLASGEMASFDRSEFPSGLVPKVVNEKRFYVIDGDAGLDWESAASGDARSVAETRYRAGWSVEYLDMGRDRLEMIKPMDGAYAALVTHAANRNLDPPIHGPYLAKVSENGIDREIYLNPLAEAL